MSDYTHKIILFTESNFSGSALVVMAKERELGTFNFSDIKHIENSEPFRVKSFIIEKGSWKLLRDKDASHKIFHREGNDIACFKYSGNDLNDIIGIQADYSLSPMPPLPSQG